MRGDRRRRDDETAGRFAASCGPMLEYTRIGRLITMPDKIVSLWKVVGEVSETAFLDPPNTQYLLQSIIIPAWPTKTLKPPQPKPTIGYNFVNRAYGHPGGAGYRRG